MFPIPDALAGFYLFCFAFGFLFIFASLFLGLSHDFIHIPGFGGDGGGADHGGVGLGGNDGAATDGGGDGSGGHAASGGHAGSHSGGHDLSPVNMSTIMAFVTWFGGAGYVLKVYGGVLAAISLVGAALAGLAGGAIVFYFLARVLIPNQRILDPADYRMEGTVARVTIPMGAERVGEIVYTKGETRRSDGAKSADGSAIERGTEVVVVRYERGLAYVEPWNSYVARG